MKRDLHVGLYSFLKIEKIDGRIRKRYSNITMRGLLLPGYELLLIIILSGFYEANAQSNYYLDRFGQGGVTMTNNSPAAGIISNTTVATSSSTAYLVSWDNYYNKWSNLSTPFNSVFTLTWADNKNRPDGVLTTATTNGKYYTLQIRGLAYSDRQAVLMETDNTPQSFHATASNAVSTPTNVFPYLSSTIIITLAGSKSPQEKVFVCYTTDNWTTSKVVEAAGTGTTWSSATATIPAVDNTPGITVKHYAYTTTVAATNTSDHDLITLKFGNNGGNNYSYTVTAGWITTTTGGNWSDASTWLNNTVPPTSTSMESVTIAGNTTLDQNAIVASLTIASSKIFTASDATPRTLTITKSASGNSTTVANSGTWANGTGGSTVVFTGAPSSGDAIHAISGTIAFQNITVNKTSGTSNVGVSFGANSSVSGTVEIGSGGFVSTAPPASFYGANAILRFNQGVVATYNVGSSDYTWSTTVIPNYITISSGTVSLNDARTATGNLLIDGGTLALNAGLTINGNWTRTSGTFTPNLQTVTLSGTTNTIINTNTDASVYDLVVSKTGGAYVTLSSNLLVSHNLSISSGAVLKIPSGKAITVTNSLANSATASGLIIENNGSLITNGTVSGSATFKREIAKDNSWHLLSSPVSEQNIVDGVFAPVTNSFNSTTGATYDFYKWSEAGTLGEWMNLKKTDWTLNTIDFGATPQFTVAGGYLVAYGSGFGGITTKTFAGTLTTGDQTVALTTAGNAWNLIGNPFASAIDWGGVTKTSLDQGYYYVYNQNISNYEYYLNGTHKSTNANGKISATQGFFVKASGTSLVLPNAARVHDNNWMKSSEPVPVEKLTLTLTDGNNYDETTILFEDQGTKGKDFFDADKMFSMNSEIPQVYSIINDNQKIAFNSMPFSNESFNIPLGTYIPADGSYKLNFSGTQTFSKLPVFALQDIKLGISKAITSDFSYDFTASKTDDPNRFVLSFLNPTGTDKPVKDAMRIYTTAGKINVTGLAGNGEIIVRNMLGQVMMRGNVIGDNLQSLNTRNLPNGVYVVSVVSGKEVKSGKVVVSE